MTSYLPIYHSTTTFDDISIQRREKKRRNLIITCTVFSCITVILLAGFLAYLYGFKEELRGSRDGKVLVDMTGVPYVSTESYDSYSSSITEGAQGVTQESQGVSQKSLRVTQESQGVTQESLEGSTETQNLLKILENEEKELKIQEENLKNLDEKIKKIQENNEIIYDEIEPQTLSETSTISTTTFENHKNFKLFDLNKCGPDFKKPKIQYGNKAKELEFPWMVALSIENDFVNWCGGSLITEHLVLTAAHCVTEKNQKQIKYIRLGEFDITNNSTNHPVQDIYDFTVKIHPNYSNITGLNDIALIKLKEPAKLNQENIKTICLPFHHPKVSPQVLVIGFGLREHRSAGSDVLHWAKMNVTSLEECRSYYRNSAKVLNGDQFCATDVIKNPKMRKIDSPKLVTVDSCKGDSGSPAQFPTNTQTGLRQIQYGLVSWGQGEICGHMKGPGVYTKIYSYLQWILDNAE